MASIGGGQTVDFYYLVMDTTHPSWENIIKGACQSRHQEIHPNNNLSIYLNNAGTQALVKITAGTLAWRQQQGWKQAILRYFSEADREALHILLRTPEWKRPEWDG